MQKKVEFYSEGCLISGILYLPFEYSDEVKYPVIIMCHGFAGVKEFLLPNFANKFSKNGYIVLTFDYRGFGESEGERGKLSANLQTIDIRNAITYMLSLEEVNKEKIALWGTSYGGANVINVASKDKRVKCIMVQGTFGNGERVVTLGMNEDEKNKLFDSLEKMWIKSVVKNKNMMLSIKKVLTDEQSLEFYEKYSEKYSCLKEKITFLTTKETLEYKPEELLNDINVPILISGAENDLVNPIEESRILYSKAKEPKELQIIENARHYDLYDGVAFDKVSDKQIEWLKKYM